MLLFPSKMYFDHRKIFRKKIVYLFFKLNKCEYEHIGNTAEVLIEILRTVHEKLEYQGKAELHDRLKWAGA